MRKKTFIIFGDTKNYFPVCYVKNLCEAMIYFAEKNLEGIQTYLIADGSPVEFNRILLEIKNGFKINKRIIHIPRWLPYSAAAILDFIGGIFNFTPLLSRDVVRGITDNIYYYDISKSVNSGFKSPFSLAQGIKETVEKEKVDSGML